MKAKGLWLVVLMCPYLLWFYPQEIPNPFYRLTSLGCLSQPIHILQYNFSLTKKCYSLSVLCLSSLHLHPSGLFPCPCLLPCSPCLTPLSEKSLRINVAKRSSFKSSFHLLFFFLFDSIKTKSFCLVIYNFRHHLCNRAHSFLCAPQLRVRIYQQSECTCGSKFVSLHGVFFHV